jgi:hypothetical protein
MIRAVCYKVRDVIVKLLWGCRRRDCARKQNCLYRAVSCHQQYLAKNPNGYCGLGDTGMSCPVEVAKIEDEPNAE